LVATRCGEVKNEKRTTPDKRERIFENRRGFLIAETIKGLSGTLESVDDVERSDSLALGVFSVGNRVTDDV